MTFDLGEARRLHSPNEYMKCQTCDTNDRMASWPCATAIALGATGRPEWLNAPPPDPDTATRCTSRGGDPEGQCLHTTGHPGMHTTQLGDLWNDETGICGADMGDGDMCPPNAYDDGKGKTAHRCILTPGHKEPHKSWTGDTW